MAETVGSLVDKMSINQLKIFHMDLQTQRMDAPKEHVEACKRKLSILEEQRSDLAQELNELMDAILSGRKKLKVYRQFKMYNDPVYKSSPTKSA